MYNILIRNYYNTTVGVHFEKQMNEIEKNWSHRRWSVKDIIGSNNILHLYRVNKSTLQTWWYFINKICFFLSEIRIFPCFKNNGTKQIPRYRSWSLVSYFFKDNLSQCYSNTVYIIYVIENYLRLSHKIKQFFFGHT